MAAAAATALGAAVTKTTATTSMTMKKLQELTQVLGNQTAGGVSQNETAIYQSLVKIWDCVREVNEVIFDAACSPGGVLGLIPKNNVLEPGGVRCHESINNYAWFIAMRLMVATDDFERCRARRLAMVRFGWLGLAARELEFALNNNSVLQSAVSTGSCLWALCDREENAMEMMKSTCYPFLVPILAKNKSATGDSQEFKLLRNILQCVYNLARFDSYRDLHANFQLLPLCDELMNHQNREISLLATFTICLVFGRDESGPGYDLLKRLPNIVSDTTSILDRVLDAGDGGTVDGISWDPEELVRVLMTLSISDANKPRLKPIIPALSKALRARSENTKMTKEIITTFLQLSFEQVTMKGLQEFVNSFELAIEKAKKDAEDIALIKVLMDRVKPEVVRTERRGSAGMLRRGSRLGSLLSSVVGGSSSKQNQVMISFNWGSKETVLKIQAALAQAKFRVWFDSEQISGSITDKMFESVEGSDVILLCVSSKYKESVINRLEAEHVSYCKKPCVFLLMEKNYKANGWLGRMIGRKQCVDCTDSITLDVSGIIREMSSLGITAVGGGGGDAAALTSPLMKRSIKDFSSSKVKVIDNKAMYMSASDVSEWMKNVNLPLSLQECFKAKKTDGRALLGIFASADHVNWSMEEMIKDFGCNDCMEVCTFFYELEVLLVSKNA